MGGQRSTDRQQERKRSQLSWGATGREVDGGLECCGGTAALIRNLGGTWLGPLSGARRAPSTAWSGRLAVPETRDARAAQDIPARASPALDAALRGLDPGRPSSEPSQREKIIIGLDVLRLAPSPPPRRRNYYNSRQASETAAVRACVCVCVRAGSAPCGSILRPHDSRGPTQTLGPSHSIPACRTLQPSRPRLNGTDPGPCVPEARKKLGTTQELCSRVSGEPGELCALGDVGVLLGSHPAPLEAPPAHLGES